jgi:hypothetical protein
MYVTVLVLLPGKLKGMRATQVQRDAPSVHDTRKSPEIE